MTTLRPEHEGEIGASYEPQGAYEARDDDDDAFGAVVGGLADPLTDPIPGVAHTTRPAGEPAPAPAAAPGRAAPGAQGRTGGAAAPGPSHAGSPLPGLAPAPAAGVGAIRAPGPIPPEMPAERPVGKHARQQAAPAPAPPPAPQAQPGFAGPATPPARHAVRPGAPAPDAGGAEATAFLPRTQPAPAAAPQPSAPPAAAPLGAPNDGEATAFLPKTPPAPAPAAASAPAAAAQPPAFAAAAPAFSDAEQTLISPPLGSPAGGPHAQPPQASPSSHPAQSSRSPQGPGQPQPQPGQQAATAGPVSPGPVPTGPAAPGADAIDQETVALRSADVRRAADAADAVAPAGGRAERRKAAKAGARGRKRPQPAAATAQRPPGRPLTRIEARQAARALKDSPGVVVSRAVGELFISFGVLMLLFVTYQLWWTNVRADDFANNEASKIQSTWKSHKGPAAGAFEPGQGFAIIHIPKLDVVAPIAQGVSKEKVLDHGMVGHYSEGSLKTAMPEDKTGNFALAGHRNTHGEPFRYINQLVPGDKVVVETQDEYYTYQMTRTLPQTSPANIGVISPIPQGSGFTAPGRYITLTTCTPEFTSTYRLIVWGKMVSEQPRSQGLPAALQHH